MKRLFITIYVLMLITLLAVPFGIGPIVDEIFEDEATKLNQDIAKGTFYLISERLSGLDEASMREKLEQLRPRFGYPLGLYRMDELEIEEDHRQDFLNNLIVEEDEKEMLVQRLWNTDLVLTMGGPFPGDNLELRAIIIFWGLLILALIVPSLAWAVFINRDIRKIEAGASRFASGDHSARVRVSKVSSMVQIAAAFNDMARKTQQIFESQRQISDAVSHEIRTPLARIKFSLEMLNDKIHLESGEKNYLTEVGKDVEEIESLVDEMLTYARFGRERESSEALSRQNMVSWLKALVESEHKSLPERDIRFVNNAGLDACMVWYEPVYLGWAVGNLIRNAARYSKQCVDVVFETGAGGVCVHIDDDGPGIPVDTRKKVFEPFFRMDRSRNKESGGYGLGLAIAKRITLWHRGEISISDSLLGGTRFTIWLPE